MNYTVKALLLVNATRRNTVGIHVKANRSWVRYVADTNGSLRITMTLLLPVGSRASVRTQMDASPRTLSTRQHVAALKGVVLEEVESDYNDRLTGVNSVFIRSCPLCC